jgi:hypothetical protein
MMTTAGNDSRTEALRLIHSGTVIPAHPLALDRGRNLDRVHQRALSRYYIDAGVGGIAVGVHTTQFGIRANGMFDEVLCITAEAVRDWAQRPVALVAGIIGDTDTAVAEARLASSLGYHAALLNVAAWKGQPEGAILNHCRVVAEVMPLIGFSLLPEVGGFHLSYDFWLKFAAIENVIAIKMAPFNRYRTLEIVRAVVDARAEHRITLYTGNDDHIVLDLLQPFVIPRDGENITVRVMGGLLGHWSVWTHAAVAQFSAITAARGKSVPELLLSLDSTVTDCNGAIYDGLNDFAGCIPGCLEVLHRQGLVATTLCLDENETLSPGQADEIDRVCAAHPTLNDDDFVASHLSAWLA